MINLLTIKGNFATLSAMTRQWRIEFEGAYYHILSRGNERRNIFHDNDDRISFLEILGKMSERFEVEVYAYVLMNNHYHLLLKTNKPNISKSMQWFGNTYTRRYNIKHRRSGHLFQGRFKNFLVENDEYLTLLSCYIHRNPLRAGTVERLVDYPWSSYPMYANGKKSPEKKKEYGKIFGMVFFWDPRSLSTVSSPNICPKNLMLKFPKNGMF